MQPGRHLEVERKYDVPDTARLPDLTALPGVQVDAPLVLDQVAGYHDTDDRRLLRARVTLRRRTGGVDDGWHLKLPGPGGSREEVHLPLGPADVPELLADRVLALTRRRRLGPVVTLSTQRTLHRLRDADGQVLAEVCDDVVTVTPGGTRWREWEVELVTGDDALLDEIGALLEAAGASPSSSRSKLARALGEPPGRPASLTNHSGDQPSTGDTLLGYLRAQHARLLEQDRAVRAGDPDGVHQLRVAARRLRSALASYRPVLDAGVSGPVEDELRWLGAALAGARDAQVQQARLDTLLDTEPPGAGREAVRRRLAEALGAQRAAADLVAARALRDDRYLALLDSLEELLDHPPFLDAADRPAAEVLPWLLRDEVRRVRRRDRAWRHATGPDRDPALHAVRKAAKRLRYAAESAAPALGARADELAGRAKAVQSLLGEHQDSVVARELLAGLVQGGGPTVPEGFGYGRLHAREQDLAAALEEEYPAVLASLPRNHVRRWLRG